MHIMHFKWQEYDTSNVLFFLSYILHSSILLNVRHIGMLVVSGFAAQSFKDELYLLETGLEILSTQVISGAM